MSTDADSEETSERPSRDEVPHYEGQVIFKGDFSEDGPETEPASESEQDE